MPTEAFPQKPFTASPGRWAVPVLFLFALLVRAIFLLDASRLPTFHMPILDGETYDALARHALATGRFDLGFFWQPFFYPAFMVSVYALTGQSLLALKIIQAVIGALTCVLTARLAQRLLPPRWAWAAGAAAAVCGPLVFYCGEPLATTWEAFWAVALTLAALEARQNPDARRLLGLGLAWGLAVVTRPPFIPFGLVLAAWALWPAPGTLPSARWPRWRRTLPHAGWVALGLALITLPVAGLSRQHTGAFTPLPYSGGLNLYIGNNPSIDLTLAIRPGWEWDQLTRVPARHGIPPGPETSTFFTRQALEYARRMPLHFIKGLAVKSVQLISPRELPRNLDLYTLGEWSPVLRLLVWRLGPWGFPFGVILPLALLGGWVLTRRTGTLPFGLPLLFYAAAVVLVFPASRYRVPLLPLLLIWATLGAHRLAGWRHTRPRLSLGLLAGALAVSLLSALPGPFPQERAHYRAELYYCLGGIESRRGHHAQAEAHLREAIASDPDQANAHNSLGTVLERQDRLDEATHHYAEALRAQPRHTTALQNLAGLHYRRERHAEAEHLFRRLADLNPRLASARHQLALCLAHQGRETEALAAFYEALALAPNDAALHNNLGSALNQAGNVEDAIRHFQAAILLDPDLMQAVVNLGAMLEGQGRRSDARLLYRAALERAAARGQPERVTQYRAHLNRLPSPAETP